LSEILSRFGLGDIFGDIFGTTSRRGARAKMRGDDLRATIEIPFEQAFLGGSVPIMLPVNEQCAHCGGTGAEPGASVTTCPTCKGRGNVTISQGYFGVQRTCPSCGGRGTIPQRRCTQCGGSGMVTNQRRIMVKIPPGTSSGTVLRLRGLGSHGTGGAPNGDLFVHVIVKPHRTFHIEGENLVAQIKIPFTKALLGTKVKLRIPQGKTITVNVPGGTKPGTRLRIKNMGVRRNARKGDLFAEIQYDIPEKLTPEQEEALRKFESAAKAKGKE